MRRRTSGVDEGTGRGMTPWGCHEGSRWLCAELRTAGELSSLRWPGSYRFSNLETRAEAEPATGSLAVALSVPSRAVALARLLSAASRAMRSSAAWECRAREQLRRWGKKQFHF